MTTQKPSGRPDLPPRFKLDEPPFAGNPPIWSIGFSGGGVDRLESTYLDGNIRKVIADVPFNEHDFYIHPVDGRLIHPWESMTGVRYRTDHLPTRMRWHSKPRHVPDIFIRSSKVVVSPKFREVVESFEPDRHQFEPLEMFWKDGSEAGTYFWLFTNQRIDGMDRELTTHPYEEDIGRYDWKREGQWVANLDQIGDAHLWVDVAAHWHYPRLSNALKEALDKAGMRGAKYAQTPCVRRGA